MRKMLLIFVCIIILGSVHAQKIMGFTDSDATVQKSWEKQYDAQLKTSDQDEWMKFLSSHPHHVGSPQDKDKC